MFVRNQIYLQLADMMRIVSHIFLMTLFFFILACNLLGLIPWAGSAGEKDGPPQPAGT